MNMPQRLLRRLAAAGCACLLAVSIAPLLCAAEVVPSTERFELIDASGKRVYDKSGGKSYLLWAESLAKAPRTTALGIEIKLRQLSDGTILAYGNRFDKVTLRITGGLAIRARLGDNLWLGGTLTDRSGSLTFDIQAWAPLPSDVELVAKRLKALPATAMPEEAYELGAQLELGRHRALEVAEAEDNRYVQTIRAAYLWGLERDIVLLKDEAPGSRAKRCAELSRRWAENPETSTGETANWLLKQYQSLLKTAGKLGQPSGAEQAEAALFLGRFLEKLEAGSDRAAALYLAGISLQPGHGELGQALERLGYVRDETKQTWALPTAASNAPVQITDDPAAREAASREVRLASASREAERRRRLAEGTGVPQAEITMDELLQGREIAELETRIRSDETPEEAVRYLFQMLPAPLSEPERLRLLTAGLESPIDAVRMDAAERLALWATSGAVDALSGFLVRTENPGARRGILITLRSLPRPKAVPALLQLAGAVGMPDALKGMVLDTLRKKTGADAGSNVDAWKTWWAAQPDAARESK